MKKSILIFLAGTCLFLFKVQGQDTATNGNLIVWSEQGWIMKARNDGATAVIFKYSWATVGLNAQGEEVSRTNDESQETRLNPGDSRQLFTAPQDPKREITYVFRDIVITSFKEETKQSIIEEKTNLRRRMQ